MIWYKTKWQEEIHQVEIQKYTDACVWINGRRYNRISNYECYYPSLAKAQAALSAKANAKIDIAKREILKQKENLKIINSISFA